MHHSEAKWIWRCHVDSSQPDPNVWAFLVEYVASYDAVVFTMAEFVPRSFSGPAMHFIPPAIGPLSIKNRALPRYLCREVVSEFGVDLARPMLAQISRFDPWKDPLGVIEAYRMIKDQLPETQLVLIGAMADDDPEGWDIYETVRQRAEQDPDLHVFTNLNGVRAHEVSAFQRLADVVIQKSVREGFGLVLSEALWKDTPVVAGNTGGIPMRLSDGIGGFLVDTVEECADRAHRLLPSPDEAETVGRKGHEHEA